MSATLNSLRGFQQAVGRWYNSLFKGTPYEHNTKTLALRFLEEALELAQAAGLKREDAIRQVDYVFNRPVGEPFQEVGGTMITLQHIARKLDVDVEDAAITEFNRINTPEMRAKIYAKQQFKNDSGLIA